MIRAYEILLTADKKLVNGQIFNAGWENQSVNQITETVKNIVGPDITIVRTKTDDNRSYHISSDKIKNVLNFQTMFTIEDAVRYLKEVFEKKLLIDTLNNDLYFNIKRMKNLDLK